MKRSKRTKRSKAKDKTKSSPFGEPQPKLDKNLIKPKKKWGGKTNYCVGNTLKARLRNKKNVNRSKDANSS